MLAILGTPRKDYAPIEAKLERPHERRAGSRKGFLLAMTKNQWRRVLEKSMELINVTAIRTTRAARRA
jgi:hypothetical protein